MVLSIHFMYYYPNDSVGNNIVLVSFLLNLEQFTNDMDIMNQTYNVQINKNY